jgi:riboflavin kinase/FMN adenylyltransferase
VAIGKFDGVHMGHRKLIDTLLRQKANGLKTAVFTFDPSPAVLFGRGGEEELTTRAEKRLIFERLGVDYLVEFPLTRETAATAPEAFVRNVLVKQMHAAYVAAGDDLSFGDRGRGNFDLLEQLSDECGYTAEEISKVRRDGVVISSTYIRMLVREGMMEDVMQCCGEPYAILGTILHGNEIGRTIGIPTLNQMPPADKLLPPFGVYYSEVEILDEEKTNRHYRGMTNIGIKPTVTAKDGMRPEEHPAVTVETYLYGFSGDIYGKTALCSLYTFRRPERRFATIEELKEVMQKDIEAGRHYHQTN